MMPKPSESPQFVRHDETAQGLSSMQTKMIIVSLRQKNTNKKGQNAYGNVILCSL